MSLLRRKRVLAAKIETTIGTAETLTGSEGAFNVYDPVIQASVAMQPREGQGGFGHLSSVPEGHIGTATFKTMLEWDGTATEPAWADTFLPACGWVKSTDTYYPTSEAPGSSVKTLTIGCYVDGVRKMLAGAMGKFTINLPTGKPAFIEWEFTGVWQAVADVAILAPTYPTEAPLRFSGGFAQWNSVNLCVENTTIDSGNEVYMRECPTTTSGYISALVTNRKPVISTNPEAVLVGTQDRWAAWLAQTEYALNIEIDGVNTSTITISAPKAQIINEQEGDRSGLVTDDIEFACNKNGATHDQELSILFTATV